MSNDDTTKAFLKTIFEKLEAKFIAETGTDYFTLAESWANLNEASDLAALLSLQASSKKHLSLERTRDAHLDTLATFIKAKQLFADEKIESTLDLLFTFHFMLGKIDQNMTTDDALNAEATKKSKQASDKRYEKDRVLKAKAKQLLVEKMPDGGWKNRTIAAESILPELENFLTTTLLARKKNATPGSASESRLGSKLDPSNLHNALGKWLKNKEGEIGATFIKTASAAWLKQFAK